MDDKKKRAIALALILGNLIVWSIFIIPQIDVIQTVFFGAPETASNVDYTPTPQTSDRQNDSIDFTTLRDPFKPLIPYLDYVLEPEQPKSSRLAYHEYRESYRPNETIKELVVTNVVFNPITSEPLNYEGVSYPIGSRYNPNNYNSTNNPDTSMPDSVEPVSDNGEFVSKYTLKSQPMKDMNGKYIAMIESTVDGNALMVAQGEEAGDEKVVKITKNAVFMSKNKRYYKLTMDGGFVVDKPK